MRIILLSFLLLFNYSNHVTSCPSSGDGDCVPSTDAYNKGSNKDTNKTNKEKSKKDESQAIRETSEQKTSSSYDSYESEFVITFVGPFEIESFSQTGVVS